jgi:hypothetical protein
MEYFWGNIKASTGRKYGSLCKIPEGMGGITRKNISKLSNLLIISQLRMGGGILHAKESMTEHRVMRTGEAGIWMYFSISVSCSVKVMRTKVWIIAYKTQS